MKVSQGLKGLGFKSSVTRNFPKNVLGDYLALEIPKKAKDNAEALKFFFEELITKFTLNHQVIEKKLIALQWELRHILFL